jgi:mRNA interferase MazF
VVITREQAIPALSSVTVALVTSTIRELPSEVRVGPEQGLDHESVVNCDNLITVPKTSLGGRRGRLGPDKLFELRKALMASLGLDQVV